MQSSYFLQPRLFTGKRMEPEWLAYIDGVTDAVSDADRDGSGPLRLMYNWNILRTFFPVERFFGVIF